jgi:hypothetical protein
MKVSRFRIAAVLLTMCVMALACSEQPTQPTGADQMGIAASVAAAAATITVPPSGGDDTGALQGAFDAAVAAGPGSVVQLEAGTYCVTSPIIVRSFDGYWRGAGRDETIVQTCQDPFPVPLDVIIDPTYPADPPYPVVTPFFFAEVEGKPPTNLSVSDLTIQLNGLTNEYFRHGVPGTTNIYRAALIVQGMRPSVVDWDISEATLKLDKVAIKGSPGGTLFGVSNLTYNSIAALWVSGGTEQFSQFPGDISDLKYEGLQATWTVTRSHFEGVADCFDVVLGLCQACPSSVVIGGSPNMGNTMDVGARVVTGSQSGGSFEFSHNKVKTKTLGLLNHGGQFFFGIDGPPQPDTPQQDLVNYVFAHNEVELASNNPVVFANGLEMQDWYSFFGGQTMNVLIDKNDIHSSDPVIWAAVDGYPTQNVLVTNNRITGDFRLAGIALGYDGLPGSGWMIKGNNLQNASVLFTTQILFGSTASNNTVVGGSNMTNVLDNGTNNVLTGVNNLGGGIGQDVTDAMQRKRDALRWLP